MEAKEMLYQFELSADKVSSKSAINLPLAAKVTYLNRGQIAFVLSHYDGGATPNGKGFEETQRRTQDLQRLVKPDVPLKAKKLSDEIYSVDLKEATGFMFLLRHRAYGFRPGCKPQRFRSFETRTDDISEQSQDPNASPNWQWRELGFRTAQDQLRFFTDGTFGVSHAVIDYLIYPNRIDVAGYSRFDASDSEDIACALPDYTHYAIITMAAMELQFDLNNPGAQSTAAKLQIYS